MWTFSFSRFLSSVRLEAYYFDIITSALAKCAALKSWLVETCKHATTRTFCVKTNSISFYNNTKAITERKLSEQEYQPPNRILTFDSTCLEGKQTQSEE